MWNFSFQFHNFKYLSADLPFVPDFSVEGKDPKIVGGSDAYIEDVRYQVSLRRLFQNATVSSWGHTCGGEKIKMQILTLMSQNDSSFESFYHQH